MFAYLIGSTIRVSYNNGMTMNVAVDNVKTANIGGYVVTGKNTNNSQNVAFKMSEQELKNAKIIG